MRTIFEIILILDQWVRRFQLKIFVIESSVSSFFGGAKPFVHF